MGCTHYWKRDIELSPDAFAKAISDCRMILAAVDVRLAGHHSEGKPVFTRDEIAFNGVIGEDCETFCVLRIEVPPRPGRQMLSYCKTEKLPYNLCVKCALIILAHHLGDAISVTSDETDANWVEARTLCQSYLGYGDGFRLTR